MGLVGSVTSNLAKQALTWSPVIGNGARNGGDNIKRDAPQSVVQIYHSTNTTRLGTTNTPR